LENITFCTKEAYMFFIVVYSLAKTTKTSTV